MRVATELFQDGLGECFATFRSQIDPTTWRRVASSVAKEIRGHPFLHSYLRSQFSMAFSLTAIEQCIDANGHRQLKVGSDTGLYEACGLIAQFAGLQPVLPPPQFRGLGRRIGAGMSKAPDLRALQFELQVATHLSRHGYSLEFPETVGAARFDILASRDGEAFEFECKSVSNDKGRQVHRRPALEIHQALSSAVGHLVDGLSSGLIVRITFPGRAVRAREQRLRLCRDVLAAILSNKAVANPEYRVELVEFKIEASPFADAEPTVSQLDEFLKPYGLVNREAMAVGRRRKGAIIFALESDVPDDFLGQTFDAISFAAKKQLSGQRGAVVCVKFEDLSAERMLELGSEVGEPTALRIAASKFLDGSAARNMSQLGFFADGNIVARPGNVLTREGRVYLFGNERNPHWRQVESARLFQ